jgi:hypothetical protein
MKKRELKTIFLQMKKVPKYCYRKEERKIGIFGKVENR